MEWYLFLIILFVGLLFFMLLGIPIAFCFLIIIMAAAPYCFGWGPGLGMSIQSITYSLMNFALIPIPLFILMGEIIFHSRIAPDLITAVDKWIGRIPGRLSILAVLAGALFSTLTGTSIASTAMLGGTLAPEMEKRGYSKAMSFGPILGSGGLAIMIPPSSLAVLLGAIGEISIGAILIAIIVPGIMLAVIMILFIVIKAMMDPAQCPAYDVQSFSLADKMKSFVRYILPIGFIIFLVVGVIYLGVATPSEAAATGAFGCFLYSAIQGRLTFEVIKKSLAGTVKLSVMILFIMTGSQLYSQVLAFSGSVAGLTNLISGIQAHPYIILIVMQLILLLLGMFMNSQSIMMITLPIYMPIINALGFDPVWFAVIYLINIEMGAITPPFGLALFVMKGVASKGTTMQDVARSALPYIGINILAMALIMIFPQIAMVLVHTMAK